jgi:hypothetical protein
MLRRHCLNLVINPYSKYVVSQKRLHTSSNFLLTNFSTTFFCTNSHINYRSNAFRCSISTTFREPRSTKVVHEKVNKKRYEDDARYVQC